MPQFTVEIFKRLGGETWSNRYLMTWASMAGALPASGEFLDAERAFHSDQVTFTSIRLSTAVPGDNEFAVVPVNLPGLVPGTTTGGLLPLWNVAKMYANRGYARPYYKLYRGVLGEANTDNGLVSTGTQDTIEAAFAEILGAETPYWVTTEDVGINSVNADPFIRHRQLHRGRRRQQTSSLVTPE